MPGMISVADRAADTPLPPQSAPATSPPKGSMDPILDKVKQGVESQLPPELKAGFEQIVKAGMKLLYADTTHPAVQKVYDKVAQGGFQPTEIATKMVNFLGILALASRGKIAFQAAYPAAVVLLCYVLDDLEKTRGLKVTEPLVKDIGKQMAQIILNGLKGQGGAPAQPPTPPTTPQPAMGGA